MKFLGLLLSEGNRKMVMSLIAIIITVVTEKYGGGLSDKALEALVYIVGIFAGGNVAEHFANALKLKHGGVQTHAPVEDEKSPPAPAGVTVEQLTAYTQQIAKDATARFKAIEEGMAKQANSIQSIVNLMNKPAPKQQEF